MSDQTVIPPARQPGGPMMIKNLIPRLPERGKIKLGIKGKTITSQRGNQFQPPQKLDFFLVTTLDRGPDGNFIRDEEFHKKHGDRPTEIPITFLFDDPVLNFQTRYAAYNGRTLWCSGDGEVATRISADPRQPAAKEPLAVKCPCERQDPTYDGPLPKCKMNGSLSVLIEGAGGLGGVWKLRTTSWNTITGILSSMAFIRSVTGGPLAGIPFKLVLQKKRATKPGTQDPVDIFIVNLTYAGTASDLMTAGHHIALERTRTHLSIEHIEEEARRLLLLPMPENAVLPGDDAEEVIDEFYVDDVVIAPVQEIQTPEPQPDLVLADDPNRTWPFVRWNGEPSTMPTRKKAIEAVEKILQARAKHGVGAIDEAWENNKILLTELREAGYGDEAEGLVAAYVELRNELAPTVAVTPPPETAPEVRDGKGYDKSPEVVVITNPSNLIHADDYVPEPEMLHPDVEEERSDQNRVMAEDNAEQNESPFPESQPEPGAIEPDDEPPAPQQELIPPSSTRQSREKHDPFWDGRSLAIPAPAGKGKGAGPDWRVWPLLIQQRIRHAWTKETLDTLYSHNEENFRLFATARGERELDELKAMFDRARDALPFAADL